MYFENLAREEGFEVSMSMSRGQPHPNKIVREFLSSHADASHLFFAKQVIPRLDIIDFEIDYHITNLSRRLREEGKEVQHEDF